MAKWIKNTHCPRCGSKDNLGVWDDGSTHCWGGCGEWSPPKVLQLNRVKSDIYINVYLPNDVIDILPTKALDWLAKYHLTKEELSVIKPLYSYEKDLLVFPIYDDQGELLMWQGRYFGDNTNHPKYLTYGAKNVLHIVGVESDTIVVTEDLVSAVRVGSVINAMPLWGSSMPLESIIRLSKRFKYLSIWLDNNKAKESLKTRIKASPYFDGVLSIVTELDPKCYSVEQIKEILNV